MTGHRPSDSEANSLSQRVPLTPWMTASGMDWSALTAGLSPEILPKGGILYQQGSPPMRCFSLSRAGSGWSAATATAKTGPFTLFPTASPWGKLEPCSAEPTIFKRWPSAGVPSTGYPLPCSAVVWKPFRPGHSGPSNCRPKGADSSYAPDPGQFSGGAGPHVWHPAPSGRTVWHTQVRRNPHQSAFYPPGDGGFIGGVPRLREPVLSGVHPAGIPPKTGPLLPHFRYPGS